MLDAYAQSLKRLQKENEFVQIGLKILARFARCKSSSEKRSQTQSVEFSDLIPIHGGVENYLSTILATSKSLNVELAAPLNEYFDNIQIDTHIHHFPDQDGFGLCLNLRSLLFEELPVTSIRARIISTESDQVSDIWLAATEAEGIGPGFSQIFLRTKVRIHGTFPVLTIIKDFCRSCSRPGLF